MWKKLPESLAAQPFDDRRPRRKGVAQFANGALEYGMPLLRSDFRQWLEDESPFVHGGMRNRQSRRIYDGVTEQQNIDIDGARPFYPCGSLLSRSPPSHRSFNPQKLRQKLLWHFLRLQFDHAVQKPGLLGVLDRLSFINRRHGLYFAQFAQAFDRGPQIRLAIADVRPQR